MMLLLEYLEEENNMSIFNSKSNNKRPAQKKKTQRVTQPATQPVKPQYHNSIVIKDESSLPEKPAEPVKRTADVVQKAPDPDKEFKMMYGLTDDQAESIPPKVEKATQPAVTTVTTPTTVVPASGVKTPFKGTRFTKTVYKRLVNKTLTIILVENTTKVMEEANNIAMIAKAIAGSIKNSPAKSGLVCVINYGKNVKKSEIFEINEFTSTDIPLLYKEEAEDTACLFDALAELEQVVSANYFSIEEKAHEKVMINNIEIVGIGTCRDNGSLISKDEGVESFSRVVSRAKITTKYYALTDEFFVETAEIGFRSIGAISRSYQ